MSEETTTERLIFFFSLYPAYLPIIISDPSNVEVWEQIFIFFFGEEPKDDENKIVPDYWRAGSTDPRWDILLFKAHMGAMRALDRLVHGWRNGDLELPTHKEAA